MKPIQQLISAGFAVSALVTASVPALAWSPWPAVDFEWYADVGKPLARPAGVEVTPPPRAGYIWAPGHWEARGARQQWVAGHWVRDEYDQQLAQNAATPAYAMSETPVIVRDRDSAPVVVPDATGRAIPPDPAAYPIDSNRR